MKALMQLAGEDGDFELVREALAEVVERLRDGIDTECVANHLEPIGQLDEELWLDDDFDNLLTLSTYSLLD